MGLPNGYLYCKLGAYQLEPVNGTGAGGRDLGVRGDFKVIGAVQNVVMKNHVRSKIAQC